MKLSAGRVFYTVFDWLRRWGLRLDRIGVFDVLLLIMFGGIFVVNAIEGVTPAGAGTSPGSAIAISIWGVLALLVSIVTGRELRKLSSWRVGVPVGVTSAAIFALIFTAIVSTIARDKDVTWGLAQDWQTFWSWGFYLLLAIGLSFGRPWIRHWMGGYCDDPPQGQDPELCLNGC